MGLSVPFTFRPKFCFSAKWEWKRNFWKWNGSLGRTGRKISRVKHFFRKIPAGPIRSIYYLPVCKKYGYSLDSLHHLFHSLIIPLFTYGISVWVLQVMDQL